MGDKRVRRFRDLTPFGPVSCTDDNRPGLAFPKQDSLHYECHDEGKHWFSSIVSVVTCRAGSTRL